MQRYLFLVLFNFIIENCSFRNCLVNLGLCSALFSKLLITNSLMNSCEIKFSIEQRKYQNLAVQKRIKRIIFLTLSLSRTFQCYHRKLQLSQLFDQFESPFCAIFEIINYHFPNEWTRRVFHSRSDNSQERERSIELPKEISKCN